MNPESYAEFVDVYDNQIQRKKERVEPWRLHPDGEHATLIPVDIALRFAYDNRLKTIYNHEKEYIHQLADDIGRNGLHTPLEMKVDDDGKICVKEGHHRLVAVQLINVVNVPIVLRHNSKRVTGYGRQLSHYSLEVWEAIGQGLESMLE